MSNQPISPAPQKKSGGSVTLIVILAVLVILMAGASGFLGWLYLSNSKTIEESKKSELKSLHERDSIDLQLTNLQAQFDLWRETQSHSIDSVIEAKNIEIENLRMQNRSGGMGSGGSAKLRAEIKRLKEELAQMVAQIEELKSKNADLTNANIKLNADLTIVRDENAKLATTNQELSTQVDIAKHIKISAIKSNAVRVAKNGKEKETDKSKKANKIESCFTVFENDVVEKGDKDAHLVIVDPAGKVLGASADNTFESEGSQISYTAQKGFYFEGRKVEMCMDYTDAKDLAKGTYNISVYIEKRLAAKSKFDLR